MQERLSIRRDRFREGIRKEHNQTILKKKRIEIIEAIEAREDPIMQLVGILDNQHGKPFNSSLLYRLLEYTARADSEKSYILVGNYLIDHLKDGAIIASQFYRQRTSAKGYFAWVVRLLLTCPSIDYQVYKSRIDSFLGSINDKAVEYGMACVEYLVEMKQYHIVLNMENLALVVRAFPHHVCKSIRSQSNDVVITLLMDSESAREKFISSIGVNSFILQALSRNEFNQRERCLEALLAIYNNSLQTIASSEVFRELVLIHEHDTKLRLLVCDVFMACARSLRIEQFCVLLNEGLKNIMCSRLDIEIFDNEYKLKSLQLIETVFHRLDNGDQHDLRHLLYSYLCTSYQLETRLERIVQDGTPELQKLAHNILSSNYSCSEEEYLLEQSH